MNNPWKTRSITELIRLVCSYVFIACIICISLYPLIWVVFSSFKTTYQIIDTPLKLPDQFNLYGYRMAFEISPFLLFYRNSVIVTAFGVIGNLVLLALSAYVLSRVTFKGRNSIILILSVSLVLPVTALMQPIYMLVIKSGLYDTKLALILVYITLGLPITLYILLGYYKTIPMEMEESAMLEGASFPQIFFRIIVPISTPGYATAAVLQFILCWQEFLFAFILTTGNASRTLPIALQYFLSQFNTNYTALFAAIVMFVIPIIVFFMIFQRKIISGLTDGSVKE
ncbi:MAG: carbohydrate ABC transporter permease [Sphaerochaetaceae bacterium]